MPRIFIFIFLLISNTWADQPPNVEYPMVDAPFNFHRAYSWPSMDQALKVSSGFYRLSHWAIDTKLSKSTYAARVATHIGFDLISLYVPLGVSWLHEEWHRAVMSRRSIHSFNEVYEIPLFKEVIKVKEVQDQDLIALKAQYPAELIRLSAAGLESHNEFVGELEHKSFFEEKKVSSLPILWLNVASSISYLGTCNFQENALEITQQAHRDEGASMDERDFTGLDCLAWVYDLFRPEEPYSNRGLHPSGVGIDRYILHSDLDPHEKNYLRRVYYKSFLNLLDPFLFGQKEFGSSLKWNFSLRHYLTSFGDDLMATIYLKDKAFKARLKLHQYSNYRHQFYGLEAELYQVNIFNLLLSTGLSLWDQPSTLNVRSSQSEIGGAVDLRLDFPLKKYWHPYLRVIAKTQGWKAGHVYLEDNVTTQLGFVIWN